MTDIVGGAPFRDQCVKQKGRRSKRDRPAVAPEVAERLEELLPADVLDDVLAGLGPEQITGNGGLLTQLAGRVIEAALGAELTEHLGYEPGRPRAGANERNGSTPKTLQTEIGEVRIRTPRDRDASFQPQLVKKRQTRLAGLDDRVLDLYAGGMSTRDIATHLTELYGTEVGRDTISRVTGAVQEDVAAWRSRPLEAVYPVVYFDAMRVKVRQDRVIENRACYLALGITLEGRREPLGIWWQDHEGAKFWMGVLNDLHQRGVGDILIACVDGLTGFPDAIEAVFPDTMVQTCIVHEIRSSTKYVSYKDLRAVTRDLRPIYTATNADDALAELERFDQKWGGQYPMIAKQWRRDWEHVIPFLALPQTLRHVVYTTNTIEAMHRQVRKAIKTRGSFPDEESATRLIYLAITRAETKWRAVRNWTQALAAFKIYFEDRIPD
jgi:transposase-like protein